VGTARSARLCPPYGTMDCFAGARNDGFNFQPAV
jgi:hypothetical protein